MSQNKIEHNIYSLEKNSDMKSQISNLCDEFGRGELALAHTMFGHGDCQDRRILAKLSQYLEAGHVDMALKLLNLRPDLDLDIKNALERALYVFAGIADQNNMEIILRLYPEFFYTYAPIKDISGIYPVIDTQDYKGITVFQHAIWTGDIHHMCKMMLDVLPTNAVGEKLKVELLRQYKELMVHGVVYEVNGKKCREAQFNLQPLIDGIKEYVEQCNSGLRTQSELSMFWCTHVGVLQNVLPAIVRHHYCNRTRVFWFNPDFHENILNRSLTLHIYDDKKDGNKMLLWNGCLEGLGTEFAISGASWSTTEPLEVFAVTYAEPYACDDELKSLVKLQDVTMKALSELSSRLTSLIPCPEDEQVLNESGFVTTR